MDDFDVRARQQANALQRVRAGMAGIWRDQAARDVNGRYLDPHAEADDSMRRDLAEEKAELAKAAEHTRRTADLAAEVTAKVELSVSLRREAAEDVKAAFSYIEHSEDERQVAQDSASAGSEALLAAETVCSGIAGPAGGDTVPVEIRASQGGGGDLLATIRSVNPGGPSVPGRSMNCANCAMATDSCLAGRPAVADPGEGPVSHAVIEEHFGGRFVVVDGEGEIRSLLSAAGPGARGIVLGVRGSGVGHVFNAVNSGGTVTFLDGQIGGYASFSADYTGFAFLRTN